MRQVLIALGVGPHGGNYHVLKKYIKIMGLDTKHFVGRGWAKGIIIGNKRPTEDYLNNKAFIGSNTLKKRLIREGFFQRKCYSCENTEWMGKPISLELHHQDGNYENNGLSNMQILCPNCHAQTTNYCSKRKKLITFNGKTQPLSVWAEEYKINYRTLHGRLYLHKWPIEKALTTPVGYRDHL